MVIQFLGQIKISWQVCWSGTRAKASYERRRNLVVDWATTMPCHLMTSAALFSSSQATLQTMLSCYLDMCLDFSVTTLSCCRLHIPRRSCTTSTMNPWTTSTATLLVTAHCTAAGKLVSMTDVCCTCQKNNKLKDYTTTHLCWKNNTHIYHTSDDASTWSRQLHLLRSAGCATWASDHHSWRHRLMATMAVNCYCIKRLYMLLLHFVYVLFAFAFTS